MGGRRGGIRVLLRLTWIELKLFLREPTTLVFTFAFPVVLLFVLGEVFGNQPGGTDRRVFAGIGAMNYYVPAYIAVVAMSVGVIMLPARLTGYRAGGVLRRFQASLVPVWAVLGSQVLAALALSVVGSVLVCAFGAVMPSTRAAQGAGLMLFFVMLFLGGAGPPTAVMSDTMKRIGDFLPLTYAVDAMQAAWNGTGWDGFGLIVLGAIALLTGWLSLRVYRWG